MRIGQRSLVTALLVVVAACSSSGESDEGAQRIAADGSQRDARAIENAPRLEAGVSPSGGGKACATNTECSGGECNPVTRTCACGGQTIAARRVAANLLIVLDRSCSMTDEIAQGVTKWSAAVGALSSLMTTYENDIRFGLTLFPDTHGASCEQDPIPFPIAGITPALLRTRLGQAKNFGDPLFPKGPCVTNIDTGMIQAKNDPAFVDKSRPAYVVLVTDGIQSPDCSAGGSNSGTLQAVKDLAANGIGTFVIGFGSGVDEPLLEAAAQAGGHARVNGTHRYFDAVDQTSLEAALQAIGGATLSCDLKLAAPLPGGTAEDVYVFFDGAVPPIARDGAHANGWDYDPAAQTIHFYGSACERLRSGSVRKQSLVIGCPGGAPPAPR